MSRSSSSRLPTSSLQSEASISPAPTPTTSSRRTSSNKRWAAFSEGSDLEEYGEEDMKPVVTRRKGRTSKGGRIKTGNTAILAAAEAAPEMGGGTSDDLELAKLTSWEKEERKAARMVRNRNAAQASRDRKKEHTHHLELRVAELEAQLYQSGSTSHVLSFPSFPFSQRSNRYPPPPSHSKRQAQRQRSHSVTSSVDETNTVEVDILEDENDSLRHALYDEQEESARLRERLDSLESNFVRMETYFQSTTGPRIPTFEPTFSFDNHTSSPKNESPSPLLSNDATLLPLSKPIITEDDSIIYTTIKEEEVESPLGKESEQPKSHIINLRLVAREVDLSLQRKLMINSKLFLPLFLLPFLLLLPIALLSNVLLHLLPPFSPWTFSALLVPVPVISPSSIQKAKDPLYLLHHPLLKYLTGQKKLTHPLNSRTRASKMRK